MYSLSTTATRTLLRSTACFSRRSLSTQGQEAVCRLKDALEQYRVANYQQEIPSRFKKDMVSQCNLTAKNPNASAVEGIEDLLQNIGVFGEQVTHDDVERIVCEFGEEIPETTPDTIRADKILNKIL